MDSANAVSGRHADHTAIVITIYLQGACAWSRHKRDLSAMMYGVRLLPIHSVSWQLPRYTLSWREHPRPSRFGCGTSQCRCRGNRRVLSVRITIHIYPSIKSHSD